MEVERRRLEDNQNSSIADRLRLKEGSSTTSSSAADTSWPCNYQLPIEEALLFLAAAIGLEIKSQRLEDQNSKTVSSRADNSWQCNQLLTEVLLRLPLKSVFRFKCLSRRWNSTISETYFRSRYKSLVGSNSLPILGFFHRVNERGRPPFSFLPVSKEGESISSLSFMKNVGFQVAGSSEGLILCKHESTNNYIVCDPSTNKWISLPARRSIGNLSCLAFNAVGFSCEACDDDDVVHFKVVILLAQVRNTIQIETFCSRIGEWTESRVTCPIQLFPQEQRLCDVFTRGVLFWRAIVLIAAYNTNTAAADGNNHNHNLMGIIQLPPYSEFKALTALGHSQDDLLQCVLGEAGGFSVWVLRKKLTQYSFSSTVMANEWICRHKLTRQVLPPTAGNGCFYSPRTSFHPRDSKLVYFRVGVRILRCDLEKRISEVIHEGHGDLPMTDDLMPYVQCAWPVSLPS